MKYCEYCNEELEQDAIFCHKCGKKVQQESIIISECPNCGASLPIANGKSVVKCEYCGGKIVVDKQADHMKRMNQAQIDAKRAQYKAKLEEKIDQSKIKIMDYISDNPLLSVIAVIMILFMIIKFLFNDGFGFEIIVLGIIVWTIYDQEKEKKGIKNKKEKNKWIALVLCIWFGVFGAHKFYEGRIKMGILYIFTVGLFGIGWLVDIILIIRKPNPYYIEKKEA